MTGCKRLFGCGGTLGLVVSLAVAAARRCGAGTPTTAPATGPVTAWSDPVNGIAVRIEQGVPLVCDGWHGTPIYLRIKNVSGHSINVPLAAASGPSDFSVWISVDDRWEKVDAEGTERSVEPEFCTLDADEDLLCPVPMPDSKRLRLAEAEKVVIDRAGTGAAADWSGRIEAPAIADYVDEAAIARIARTLPMPRHLSPVLARKGYFGVSGPGNPLPFDCWRSANRDAFDQLRLYPDRDVAAFFDQQRTSTNDYQLQMYYAAAGAARGSIDAVKAIADRDRLESRHTVEARAAAVGLVLQSDGAPDRIVEVALDLIHDDRNVRDRPGDLPDRVSRLVGDDVTQSLGESKLGSARAAVLKLAENDELSKALIRALGDNPDPRAEALLLDAAREDFPHDPAVPAVALSQLAARKCRAALPLLIDRLPDSDAVDALGDLGDPAAIPALQKIVNAASRPGGNPAVAKAKVAMIKLDPADRLSKLGQLMTDPFAVDVRYDVVYLLSLSDDSAAVPILVKAISEDRDGGVVERAIYALAELRSKTAVAGLIDALQNTKPRRGDLKSPYTAERFDDAITNRLRTLTGQSLGPEQARWKKWWHDHGQNYPR